MWAPLKTLDLEKILFQDRCWKNFSNFISIPTLNCKRCMTKIGEDLVGFLVLGSNLSYFLRRSQTMILIPSIDLLLPNFNQIVRK
jgi:hypothetical protein